MRKSQTDSAGKVEPMLEAVRARFSIKDGGKLPCLRQVQSGLASGLPRLTGFASIFLPKALLWAVTFCYLQPTELS